MTSLRESLQNVATIKPGDSLSLRESNILLICTFRSVHSYQILNNDFPRGRFDLGNSSRRDFNIFFVARNCALRKTTDY